MIKYRLVNNNTSIDFISFEDALQFKNDNSEWINVEIEEYEENIPVVYEINVEELVLKDIEKGRQVIISYLADNKKMTLTPAQDIYQMQNFAGIKALLEVGAIQTAKYLISQLPTDDILTEERKTKYLSML